MIGKIDLVIKYIHLGGLVNMSNVAYVRVSTAEQNKARQVENLEKNNIDKWYIEEVSGKDTNRPELTKMLEFVSEGDTVYIHDFSRIARNTAGLLEIVKQLTRMGVGLVSTKESIDTNTPTGKLLLTMIGAINEFERANLLERQREGIAIAKREGKYKGRKRIDKPSGFNKVMARVQAGELTATEAMKILQLSKSTYYRMAKE